MKLTLLLILAFASPSKGLKPFEATIIRLAAARNGVTSEYDLRLLYAIRLAENGRKGRELGILHPRCLALCAEPGADTLDIQAGWCAATVRNQHRRHEAHDCGLDFIACLARRYAPINCDNDNGTNQFWLKNVRWFMEH